MSLQPVKQFLIAQRDAILVAIAISLVLYASGALALNSTRAASGLSDPLFVTAPEGGGCSSWSKAARSRSCPAASCCRHRFWT
jgi:hypothetical protein